MGPIILSAQPEDAGKSKVGEAGRKALVARALRRRMTISHHCDESRRPAEAPRGALGVVACAALL
jgi:hypothetical protein